MHEIVFTKGFIDEMDRLLGPGTTLREKRRLEGVISSNNLILIFYLLRNSTRKKPAELPRDIRKLFGRGRDSEGNRFWNFKKLIEFLKSEEVVEDTSYSTDLGYCKSYYLTHKFLSKVYKSDIEFGTANLSDRTYRSLMNSRTPTTGVLLEIFNSHKFLSVDIERAKTLISPLKADSFISAINGIADIHGGHFYTTDDERTGRIFTTFNGIKREIRNSLLYKGGPLESVDLKSSQPYFLSSLLLRDNPDVPEVRQFYQLIIDGDIYEWIAESSDLYKYYEDDRREYIKKEFFRYVYKDPRGSVPVQEIMKREWPVVHRLINKRKGVIPLWLELQRIESRIFLSVANRYISQGCFSVHDGLYYPSEYREPIIDDLKTCFNRAGFSDYVLK
jgi:hypothetical protein